MTKETSDAWAEVFPAIMVTVVGRHGPEHRLIVPVKQWVEDRDKWLASITRAMDQAAGIVALEDGA